MAGFWDELRAITEAESQQGNEAFARGANIVNMLNQTTESGLNRAMDYENMAQSGLLSMANLEENSRQFNTGHKNAMEIAETQHGYEVLIAGLKHKYDMDLQNAKSEHEMNKLAEAYEFDVEMAGQAYQDQVLLLEKQNELGFTTPQQTTTYNPVYRTIMGER